MKNCMLILGPELLEQFRVFIVTTSCTHLPGVRVLYYFHWRIIS